MTAMSWRDEGGGPAVVLLHAFPLDHRMWDGQFRGLVDAGWRVLAPDLPGFGASELPDAEPSLTAVVDALIASLLDRGIDRCVVVGLSVGGYLAMEWLRRRPEMLAGVVLCDTKATADSQSARAARQGMADEIDREPSRTSQILRERVLPALVGETTLRERPKVVSALGEWINGAPAATVAWIQRAMANRQDSMSTLREAMLPILIVWGEEDALSPQSEQSAMLEALRDGRIVVIPATGHLSALEDPEPVTRAIVEFLASVRGANLDG